MWPEELLHPPGLVGEMCDWINASAGCYQPILALGAALTACGALFGRKVKDESNGRTNMYAMGVAHSSAGKDHPSSCIERLFHAAGAAKMLGGQGHVRLRYRVVADGTHGKALLLGRDRPHLCQHQGRRWSWGNAHLRTIVPTLMQLYSSPHKLYVEQRAEGEGRKADQPRAFLWGLDLS